MKFDVNVFAVNIEKEIPNQGQSLLLSYLTAKRRELLKKFRFINDFKRSLLGEILVKYVLLTRFNMKLSDIIFVEDSYGKPRLKNNNYFFNISHSGSWAVCAIGNKPVGIDIEKIETPDWSIAREFFAPDENTLLNAYEGELKTQIFYDLWTLKESYLKFSGEGLFRPLNSVEFIFHSGQRGISLKGYEEVQFKQYSLDSGYKLSVCANNCSFSPNVVKVDIQSIISTLSNLITTCLISI